MSFKGKVDQWILNSTVLTEAVIKDAAQEMAIAANTPVAKGGRMRVDTGFLRNSIAASLNSLPSGQNIKPAEYSKQNWSPSSVTVIINRMSIGDKLFIGWTAEYAQYRENQDFFARTAAQNWPQHVQNAVHNMRLRFNA